MEMESITENNSTSQFTQILEEEEEEDTFDCLSFRSFADIADSVYNSPKSTSSPPDLFQFITSISEDELLNEYQKRDYLTLSRCRSNSYTKSQSQIRGTETTKSPVINNRSKSSRATLSESHVPIDLTYHAQKVNMTSITSMSAKSRRWMYLFGMMKFKPEMELSSIKERQGRRAPVSMFPATVEKVGGSGSGKSGNGWGFVRSLRGRSHLNALLARLFGCIPL